MKAPLPPKKWLPALINSFDENWLAVGGGDDGVTSGGGDWGGIVPVVCAMTGVHATAAITLAIAATRKLIITAGSPSASNSRKTLRSRSPLSSRNERMLERPPLEGPEGFLLSLSYHRRFEPAIWWTRLTVEAVSRQATLPGSP